VRCGGVDAEAGVLVGRVSLGGRQGFVGWEAGFRWVGGRVSFGRQSFSAAALPSRHCQHNIAMPSSHKGTLCASVFHPCMPTQTCTHTRGPPERLKVHFCKFVARDLFFYASGDFMSRLHKTGWVPGALPDSRAYTRPPYTFRRHPTTSKVTTQRGFALHISTPLTHLL
jgi:hypothetical protein